MELLNLAVKHKVLGEGVIVETNGAYMTIRFGETLKKFVYPDAFLKFLSLRDGTVPDDIRADLEAEKKAREALDAAKRAENELAMSHGIVIPGKEIVPESKEDDESTAEPEEI